MSLIILAGARLPNLRIERQDEFTDRRCAIHAAGEAKTEKDAHDVVWDAIQGVSVHAPVRVALERAALDVAAVARALRGLEDEWQRRLNSEELAQLRSAVT